VHFLKHFAFSFSVCWNFMTSFIMQVEDIHAKALQDIRTMRKAGVKPCMPPLRGLAGKVFVTPKGRKLSAEQYLASVERFSHLPGFDLLQWNTDGSVVIPPPAEDPYARILSKAAVQAMSRRLCTVVARPPRPPPRPAIWESRQLIENKWVAVEQPWKHSTPQAKEAALCAMYQR
jgi:hypothetical protein